MNTTRQAAILRMLASVTIVCTANTNASAAALRVISPSEAANVDGDDDITPGAAPLRIQFLYPAADFAPLPATHRNVVGFNYRADYLQTKAVDWNFPDEQIWISTTDKTNLTTTFDDNHGPDKTLVFDGSASYRILGTGPALGPRDIAPAFAFQTPFVYDPSQGNLLVERRYFATSSPIPSPTTDVQNTSSSTILVSPLGDPNATTGVLIGGLPVTQFEFEVLQPGDYNGNGTVDAADYVVWRDSLGKSGMGLAADGDGSGEVDEDDYSVWKSHFGQSPLTSAAGAVAGPSTTEVPEPATFALLLLLSTVFCFRSRRSRGHAIARFRFQS